MVKRNFRTNAALLQSERAKAAYEYEMALVDGSLRMNRVDGGNRMSAVEHAQQAYAKLQSAKKLYRTHDLGHT